MAARAAAGFGRFWNAPAGYCYDVIDGPGGSDAALRPNQILAVSLPASALRPERQRQVVDACARRLLVSYGLRSLAPGEPGYRPRFGGGPGLRRGFGPVELTFAVGVEGVVWSDTTRAAIAGAERALDRELTLVAVPVSLRARILGTDAEKRTDLPGMDAKRVDLMPAAAVLVDFLLRRSGAEELTACTWALREGLLLDLARLPSQRRAGSAHAPVQARPMRRIASANGPARRSAVIRPTWRMRAASSGGTPGTSRPRKLGRKADRGIRITLHVPWGCSTAW